MTAKPSYEELEKRVQELEKIESEHKYSKEALRESESLFKMLYEKAPLGYQSLDENGHFIVVNQTWLDILGYSREEVIGKSFAEFLHPDWRDHFKENFPRFKSIGEVLGVEFEMVKKNGNFILVSFTGKISRDKTGNFQQTHCIFQDITERKRVDEIKSRHHEALDKINRIGRIAGSTLELEEVLRRILEKVTESVNSSVGMILLTDPVKRNITWGASLGLSEQFVNDFKETPIRIGEGLTGSIVQTGKPIFIQENSSNDPRIVRPVIVKENLNSFLGVPIFAEDKVVGVMNILTRPPVQLKEQDKHFCSAVGSQVGLAIINAKKYSELKKIQKALIESEALFRGMFKNHSAVMLLIDPNTGQIIKANQAATQYYGYSLEKMLQMKIQELNILSRAEVTKEMRSALNKQVNIFEFHHMLADGQVRDVEVHSAPITIQHQTLLFSIIRDITERKRTEDALRRNEKDLRESQRIAHVGSWRLDVATNQVVWTEELYNMYGFDPSLPPPPYTEHMKLFTPESWDRLSKALAHTRETGIPYTLELETVRKDGNNGWMWVQGEADVDSAGKTVELWGAAQDITERKRAETYREMEREILQILNLPGNLQESIQKVLAALKTRTGVDAVGLRLQEGEDFPYFIQDGFSKDFLLTENTLLERDKDGGVCRDKDGNVRLECTCGLVISGKTDPSNPLFTKGGSSWTNDSFPFLNLPSDQDPRLHPRNNCIHKGYSSVALIPVRIHDQMYSRETCIRHGFSSMAQVPVRTSERIVGLIQLNAKRKGRFTLETIEILESIAAHVGSALIRKQAEEALRESEAKFRAMVETFPLALHQSVGVEQITEYMNPTMVKLFGYTQADIPSVAQWWPLAYPDETYRRQISEEWTKRVKHAIATQSPIEPMEVVCTCKDGSKKNISWDYIILGDKNYSCGLDITKRKEAEAEREKLQNQLNQAQKMESVGRLAGGVAHDFNNMLGVILGHTELALLRTDDKHKLCSDLKEIQNAAKRSADITKQLLAFARKQTIAPRQLDLNDTVESMLNMLRRLIGEDIDLVWQPSAHLWPVKMDPSQIDQILANLCVNARDAIDGVGKLTIETGIKTFDEEYCNEHLGFIPGDFVLLAVSDNGCGMDKEILDNLFEPFFTTKEVGKGTGLGLATIYGIVKQNNGFINVYSESGQGSTFKIYLPRLVDDKDTDRAVPEKKAAAGGSETILLVEDEPMILDMTTTMLEMLGYTVLAAASPDEAIRLAKDHHTGKIHLLLSDVVMPEMNGRDLAAQITALYPGIRLLFMSGYTADVIANQGMLDAKVAFIQKPFSMADMTEKVRELLDMASDKS